MPLEELWRENETAFRKVARSLVGDPFTCEDILQESYLRLMRRRTCREPTYPYLRQVVVHQSLDHFRRCGRRTRRLLRLRSAHVPESVPTPLSLMLDREEEALRQRILSRVRDLSSGLTPEMRFALDVYFGRRELSIRETCRRRNLPYSTLRSRLLMALRRLRIHLREEGLYQEYLCLRRGQGGLRLAKESRAKPCAAERSAPRCRRPSAH